MATLRSPFRYDFVGSFLRPQAIKTARVEFKAGEITREQLTAVENEQITLLMIYLVYVNISKQNFGIGF